MERERGQAVARTEGGHPARSPNGAHGNGRAEPKDTCSGTVTRCVGRMHVKQNDTNPGARYKQRPGARGDGHGGGRRTRSRGGGTGGQGGEGARLAAGADGGRGGANRLRGGGERGPGTGGEEEEEGSEESDAAASDMEPASPVAAGAALEAERSPEGTPQAPRGGQGGEDEEATAMPEGGRRTRAARVRAAAEPGETDTPTTAVAALFALPRALVTEMSWAAAEEVEATGGTAQGAGLQRGIEERMHLPEGDIEAAGFQGAVDHIIREVYRRWREAGDAGEGEERGEGHGAGSIAEALRVVAQAGYLLETQGGGTGGPEEGGGEGTGGPTQDAVRREVAAIMAEPGGGQGRGGTARQVTQRLWQRIGAQEGEHYQRNWLREEVQFRAEVAEHAARKGAAEGAAGDGADSAGGEPGADGRGGGGGEEWWPGDAVRINEARIKERWKWMLGDAGTLVGRTRQGRWRVAVEGREGRAEVDVEEADADMLRRREFTARDHAVARRAEAVDGGDTEPREQEGVRLIRRTGGGRRGTRGRWRRTCGWQNARTAHWCTRGRRT